jgi:hypothetical protein
MILFGETLLKALVNDLALSVSLIPALSLPIVDRVFDKKNSELKSYDRMLTPAVSRDDTRNAVDSSG